MMPTTSRAHHREFSPEALIDAMRDAGMTTQDLAREMGASEEAIARWRSGIAVPKPGYRKQAARILGVTEDSLFE